MKTTSLFNHPLIHRLAVLLWLLVAGLCLAALVASLVPGYQYYASLCIGAPCFSRLVPETYWHLQRLGLSPAFYGAFNLILYLVFALSFVVMGGLIFLRRSRDPMAWFTSLALVVYGVFAAEWPDILYGEGVFWANLYDIMSSLAWVLFPVFLYLFPDGRFVPRWTAVLAALWLWMQLGYFVLPTSPISPTSWSFELQAALLLGMFATIVYAIIYRYRRISSPLQRQQTKWVAFGMLLSIVFIIVSTLPDAVSPGWIAPSSVTSMVLDVFTAAALLLIPITITIAILRYRLWDIDNLIRRTLLYALLTIFLGTAYFTVVIVLQFAVRALAGTNSPVAIVVSTLAIAAAANPLRLRLQTWIDRRFYRRRYDATQTLQSFATTLREDVDLSAMSDRLVDVVADTMQPAHVSLWLRRPDSGRERSSAA